MSAAPRPEPLPLDRLDPRLRPLCAAYLEADRVPGASVAIVAGDASYHAGFGVKSAGRGGAVTADTGFNVGSCSKAFVSALIASLVADGLIGWDDPIVRHVPEFELADPAATAMATLRDLSANRLGLPRVGLPEFLFEPTRPPEYLLSRLRHTPFMRPFRDGFTYVNAGHTANALAAGRVTGKGFLATLRERILDPLGMTGTSGGSAARELEDTAGWHVIDDGRPVEIDAVFTDQILGAGGMVVSGRDAARWMRLHLNGGLADGVQVVPRDALAETHRPHSAAVPGKDSFALFPPDALMGAYALGWAVSDFQGRRLISHAGGDLGATSQTWLLPDEGIGIAVYANAYGLTPITLTSAVAATLLGLPPKDWAAQAAAAMRKARESAEPAAPAEGGPARDLDVYAGAYAHPADGRLIVERTADGGLGGVFADGYRMGFTLSPKGGDAFAVRLTAPDYVGEGGTEAMALRFAVRDGRAASVDHIQDPRFPRTFRREPGDGSVSR